MRRVSRLLRYAVLMGLLVVMTACADMQKRHAMLAANSKVNNPFVAPASRLGKHFYRKQGVQVVENYNNIRVILDNDIIFGVDSAKIKPSARRLLFVVSDLVKQYLPTQVSVVSYADDLKLNLKKVPLADRRAYSLTAFLMAAGVERSYLRPSAGTETIADNDTVSGQSYNRRTELLIPYNRPLPPRVRIMSFLRLIEDA